MAFVEMIDEAHPPALTEAPVLAHPASFELVCEDDQLVRRKRREGESSIITP